MEDIQLGKGQQSDCGRHPDDATFMNSMPPLGSPPGELAMLLMFTVAIVAVISVFVPSGLEVLRHLLPLLTFVLGYYFPRSVPLEP